MSWLARISLGMVLLGAACAGYLAHSHAIDAHTFAHLTHVHSPYEMVRSLGLTGLELVAALFIVLEFAYAKLSGHDHGHDLNETAASFGVAVCGDLVTRLVTGGLATVPFYLVYTHRLFDIPLDRAWSWVALFFGVEFCYYWLHRASHRVRWLWATHAIHHSATHFNLSAAVRLGFTGNITGHFLFYLPLALIGFDPVGITAMMGVGLLYQFFLHTALPVNLGPLEYVLNSPNHHRVHHASNDACLDKNYASILIVYDRLFGTFTEAPAGETLRFGVKLRTPSNNPLWISLREWVTLARDAWAAPSWSQRAQVLFGTP